jgi:hypothetical protein
MKCYWEQFGNILGNTWGTLGELDENTTDKKTKKIPPLPLPKLKRKKISLSSILIGCIKFPFPKWFITIFNLD